MENTTSESVEQTEETVTDVLEKICNCKSKYFKTIEEMLNFAECNAGMKIDKNGNIIAFKRKKENDTFVYYQQFDKNNNCISYEDSDGYEYIRKFESNNCVYFKDNRDFEFSQTFDNYGNVIFYSDNKTFQFWNDYDENGRKVKYKDNNGLEINYAYDNITGKLVNELRTYN